MHAMKIGRGLIMIELPIEPRKALAAVWALSGGYESADGWEPKVFQRDEFTANQSDITITNLPPGDWTLVVVKMTYDGASSQAMCNIISTGGTVIFQNPVP